MDVLYLLMEVSIGPLGALVELLVPLFLTALIGERLKPFAESIETCVYQQVTLVHANSGVYIWTPGSSQKGPMK